MIMKSSHQLVFLPTGPTTLSSSEVCTTLNALHQRPTLDSKQVFYFLINCNVNVHLLSLHKISYSRVFHIHIVRETCEKFIEIRSISSI